jgi:hypothetical protein
MDINEKQAKIKEIDTVAKKILMREIQRREGTGYTVAYQFENPTISKEEYLNMSPFPNKEVN